MSGDIPYMKVGSRSCNPQDSPLAEKIFEFIKSLELEACDPVKDEAEDEAEEPTNNETVGGGAAPGEGDADDGVDLHDALFGEGEAPEPHFERGDAAEGEEHHGPSSGARGGEDKDHGDADDEQDAEEAGDEHEIIMEDENGVRRRSKVGTLKSEARHGTTSVHTDIATRTVTHV